MGNKVIKPVSFNVTKSDDAAMLKYLARKNFSGYMKKLILEDMKLKKGFEPTATTETPESVIEKPVIPTAREQIEKMRNESKKPPAPPLITKPKTQP